MKPLAMFLEPVERPGETFPEVQFDALVADGKLLKNVSVEVIRDADGVDHEVRRILYALPEEEWRIPAFLFVQEIYDSLLPGWRPDLDRVLGRLLGYTNEDIEDFVNRLRLRGNIPS